MQRGTNFTRFKRFLAGVSGIAVLGASMYLSKEGVGFPPDLIVLGWVIAIALSSAEFMFNSSFEELNWTMIMIGVGAYIYSIFTNVKGFMFYRGVETFDATSIFGGMFMDIYPELAIAWALKESKVGDLLGNVVKSFDKPETLTNSTTTKEQVTRTYPASLPKKNQHNKRREPDEYVPIMVSEETKAAIRQAQTEHRKNQIPKYNVKPNQYTSENGEIPPFLQRHKNGDRTIPFTSPRL